MIITVRVKTVSKKYEYEMKTIKFQDLLDAMDVEFNRDQELIVLEDQHTNEIVVIGGHEGKNILEAQRIIKGVNKAPRVDQIDDRDPYRHGHLIICAAVKYGDEVILGLRHADCFRSGKDVEGIHGFLDNKNEFLNREEAYKVADAAGQIRVYPPKNNLDWHKERGTEPGLFSELVW